MLHYPRPTDEFHVIEVVPVITRCFWSCRRAFQGAELELTVETKLVPDKTPVHIQIWEDDSGEGSADDFILELAPQTTLSKGRLVVRHKLEWSEEALGKEHELEGDDYEFYFRVEIPKFGLVAKSGLLYVDLEPYRFSR